MNYIVVPLVSSTLYLVGYYFGKSARNTEIIPDNSNPNSVCLNKLSVYSDKKVTKKPQVIVSKPPNSKNTTGMISSTCTDLMTELKFVLHNRTKKLQLQNESNVAL